MLKPKSNRKRIIIMLILFLGLSAMGLMINKTINQTVMEIAQIRVTQMATEAISNAVNARIAEENASYNDLVQIHKDSSGKIVLIQPNAVMLNKIATDTTLAAQASLIRLQEERIQIPLGQVTGIYFFANHGPRIDVSVVPQGTVEVEIVDKFEQAGINQTRHYVGLYFKTQVRLVIPLRSGLTEIATQVPITDSIIVGDVPGTYVSIPEGIFGGSLGD